MKAFIFIVSIESVLKVFGIRTEFSVIERHLVISALSTNRWHWTQVTRRTC